MAIRNPRLVNIIGVNSPRPEIAGVSSPELPKMEDVTNQKYGEVRQNVMRAYDTMRSAIQTKGDLAVQLAQSRGVSNRVAELQGLTETLMQGLSIYKNKEAEIKQMETQARVADLRYKAEQEKLLAEQEEAKRQEAIKRDTMVASAAIQDVLLQLQTRIRTNGREAGINTTRSDIERILAQYSYLPAETLQALRSSMYTPLNEAEKEVSNTYFEQAKEYQQNQESMAMSTLQVGLSTHLARLENPNITADEANSIFNQAFGILKHSTTDMGLEQRARIIAPLLKQLSDRALVGEGARQVFTQKMQSMNQLYEWYQEARESGLINQPTLFKQALMYEATRLGIPEMADELPDSLQEAQQQRSWVETMQYLEAARGQQANQELVARKPQYVVARAAQMAHNWHNSSGGRAQYEIAKAKPEAQRSPIEVAAIGLYDRWQSGLEQYHTINNQLATAIQQYEQVLTRANPAAIAQEGGFLPQESIYDPTAGEYRRVDIIDPSSGAIKKLPVATQNELRASLEGVRNRQAQLQQLIQSYANDGFNLQNPADATLVQQMGAQADAVDQSVQNLPDFRRLVGQPPNAGTQSNTPNFNQGLGEGAPSSPPVHPLMKDQAGHVLPFLAGQSMEVTATYGDGPGSNHGGRFHAGVDFASGRMWEEPVGVLAIQGGRVINTFDWNGYGGTVMVETPDGRVEQYSHLRSFNVEIGQSLPPGTLLGIVGGGQGDPMAGSSTGRHVHFQVWRAGVQDYGNPAGDTINPMEYLAGIKYTEPRTSGVGPAPAGRAPGRTAAPNATPLSSGNWLLDWGGSTSTGPYFGPWVYNNQTRAAAPAEQVYTQTNPIPQQNAPIDKSSYPAKNDPNANYGYQAIARDPKFARALAAAGDQLGIPAQFLADVMAFESTTNFDPHIDNGQDDGGWGHGYLGLIQINGDWLRSNGLSRSDILQMDRAEYVSRVVIPYFKPLAGRMRTVEDVLAAVFMGTGSIDWSPARRASMSDGNINFRDYVRRLGNHTGRRYRTSYDVGNGVGGPGYQVHTTSQYGCALCSQQLNRFNQIIPHEAPL